MSAPITVSPELRTEYLARVTAPEIIDELAERSISVVMDVLRQGHPLRVNASGGKDSTLVCCLALEAARRVASAGEGVPELTITSADTGIENPEVLYLLHKTHDAAVAYGLANGFTVRSMITQPRASERWWLGIVGGLKLPSFSDTNADCSVDMKGSPLARATRALDRELQLAGRPHSVTLLGTRFTESAKRGRKMHARGESAEVFSRSSIGGTICWTLSPIADWAESQVWAYLQNAGIGKRYPGYADSFSDTYSAYDAANAGECVLYHDPRMTERASGCSARFGCMSCLVVDEDQSLRNLVMHPDYDYLRPMLRLRTYLRNTRFDFSRRRWIGRQIDPETGAVKVFPNNYSAAECERLLRMLLTIDRNERARAADHAAALAAGRIADTARNRRLCSVQFQNISATDLIGIDYYWSVNVLHPPHHALRIAREIASGHGLMDVPEVPRAPRVPVPEARWRLGDKTMLASASGLRDFHYEMTLFDGEGITYRTDPKMGLTESWPVYRASPTLDIDEEGVELFLAFEAEARLAETEGLGIEFAHSAVHFYHRLGTVGYPVSMRRTMDRMLRQGEFLLNSGLAGDISMERALETTLSEAEYRTLTGVRQPTVLQLDLL